MKITTLIENHPSPDRDDLVAEFGLSLLVEHEETRILFDTGASGTFAENADRLGLDLAEVDLAILSHHHFDHGGGLGTFFGRNSTARVHLKRPPEGEPYARAFGVITRPVGIDIRLLERHADRFVFVDELTEVVPGVFLFPDIVRNHPLPEANRLLHLRTEAGWRRDEFTHELVLAVREPDGIVVFSGCSHSGILNMIGTVERHFPGVPVKGVVGGFHLLDPLPLGIGGPSRRSIEETGRGLGAHGDTVYFTGHCTSERALRELRGTLGERLRPITTGTVLTL